MKVMDRINFKQRETLESFQPLPMRKKLTAIKNVSQDLNGNKGFSQSMYENQLTINDSNFEATDYKQLNKSKWSNGFKGSKITTVDNVMFYKNDSIIKQTEKNNKNKKHTRTITTRGVTYKESPLGKQDTNKLFDKLDTKMFKKVDTRLFDKCHTNITSDKTKWAHQSELIPNTKSPKETPLVAKTDLLNNFNKSYKHSLTLINNSKAQKRQSTNPVRKNSLSKINSDKNCNNFFGYIPNASNINISDYSFDEDTINKLPQSQREHLNEELKSH